MYISDEIPSNFNKVYELSDNYIVLGTSTSLSSGQNYEVYIQYFIPSIYVVHLTDYKIKLENANSYSLDYNYSQLGGVYSADGLFTQSAYQIDRSLYSDSEFDRGDFTLIFICQFLICVWFVWLLNQLTKLVHKGGIFG